MAEQLELQIVTPDRLVLAERVDEVVLPSVEGSMGVLPGHAPLLARLQPGELSYRVGAQTSYLAISGGFAEVLRQGVSVLAETCERPAEIDLERARQARARAEAALEVDPAERSQARAALERAINRIR